MLKPIKYMMAWLLLESFRLVVSDLIPIIGFSVYYKTIEDYSSIVSLRGSTWLLNHSRHPSSVSCLVDGYVLLFTGLSLFRMHS